MCFYLTLEIKYFVSLKNESLLFGTRVHFKGELSSPKLYKGLLIKGSRGGGGGVTNFLCYHFVRTDCLCSLTLENYGSLTRFTRIQITQQ